MSNSKWFRSVVDLRPGESRAAALMASYFFLVITSFWILKPLKKTLFIGYYTASAAAGGGAGGFDLGGNHLDAAQAEQLAKVLNMVVAAVAAVLFSLLAVRLRRQQLTYVFAFFFLVAYGLFASVLGEPEAWSVWSFYLFGDLFSTLMVATFFAFLNDSVSSDAAKRLYGLVGFGGVAGGVFGSSAVAVWISTLSILAWLGVAAVLLLLIACVAGAAARHFDRLEESSQAGSANAGAETEAALKATSAGTEELPSPGPLEGMKRVFGSGYLLAIVAIVGLYELVSTVVDFQFTQSMIRFSESEAARNQNFATVFAVTNWLSMAVQLFATSFVMRRFGLGAALMVLPCAIAFASMGFAWLPSLWLGGLLNTADNAFSYSINQSAKETLYVPTTPAEKYQAKAMIDMFIQRFAKAIGVALSIVVTKNVVGLEGLRSLSFLLLPVIALWMWAAMYAGKRFKELE